MLNCLGPRVCIYSHTILSRYICKSDKREKNNNIQSYQEHSAFETPVIKDMNPHLNHTLNLSSKSNDLRGKK